MIATRRDILGGLAATAAIGAPTLARADAFGRFEGEFVGRFIGAQRAILEQPLKYIDPDALEWLAPAGVEVNGASIPRALWTIVGAPFSGGYVRASVIHDHYCTTQERHWRDTHYVFYLGCRADGLSRTFSNLLYAAVLRFGPRWPFPDAAGLFERVQGGDVPQEFDDGEFEELRRWIETEDPSVAQIQRRVL